MTRAQEAEENYLVKRELATVKQQSEEASAQLEQAQKTIRQLQQPQPQPPQQQQPHAVRRATGGLRGSDPGRSVTAAGAVTLGCDPDPDQFVLCRTETSGRTLEITFDHVLRTDTCASKNGFHHVSGVSRYLRSGRAGPSSLCTPALGGDLFWHA